MNIPDNMADALLTFVDEARELIAQMEEILLRAESGEQGADDLNALFRAAHTIKGSAGLFGLDAVVRFTHVVEGVLVRLRDGQISFSPELVTVLLECQDHINDLIHAVAENEDIDETRSDQLIADLQPWVQDGLIGVTASSATAGGLVVSETAADGEAHVDDDSRSRLGPDHWHLSLRFAPSVLADGMDPLSFVNYLKHYGRLVHVETIVDGLPEFAEADPEICYLGFEVALDSEASKTDIETTTRFAHIIVLTEDEAGGQPVIAQDAPLFREFASFTAPRSIYPGLENAMCLCSLRRPILPHWRRKLPRCCIRAPSNMACNCN